MVKKRPSTSVTFSQKVVHGRPSAADRQQRRRTTIRGNVALGEERLASIAWGADDWGIAIAVSLKSGGGPATVILRLRQVCAEYFRNTVLYH